MKNEKIFYFINFKSGLFDCPKRARRPRSCIRSTTHVCYVCKEVSDGLKD